MNIVRPYARMIDVETKEQGIALLRKIEWCGRVSHRSEEAQTDSSYDRFLRAVVIGHGDWSIVEHAAVSVDMMVDRGITHEIVRHRLFSFTQESTRFVNYEKKMPPSFIVPFDDETGSLECHQDGSTVQGCWEMVIRDVEWAYRSLLTRVPPQIARSVFPNSLASRIVVTGNIRNWRHFFLMRTTKEAHPQMRQIAIPLLAEFKEKIPILFDDIEPMARQVDNISRGR